MPKVPKISRLYAFLALFTFVYFLESIGGSYMISAVQNIERQFRIPSKLSGFLVSAHDISYVPTVIFISYFGSRGNRAKWIGAGCTLIALAHIFTATPNFFFPVTTPQLNLTEVEARLQPPSILLDTNRASVKDYFNYAPIRDRIPVKIRVKILNKIESLEGTSGPSFDDLEPTGVEFSNNSKSLYSLDEPLISENEKNTSELVDSLQHFVSRRQEFPESDLKTMRRSAIAPFAFCHQLVNDFRQVIKNIQCNNEASNVGPLLIIFIALLALGIGRTMPWTLGVPLIDDNVKSKNMPVYFGISSLFKTIIFLAMMSFIRILGPICGFLIGSGVNKIFYTYPSPPPRGLTPKDPTWIGAWWLGFLIIGIVTIIPSIVLFFFPEESRKKNNKISNVQQQNGNGVTILNSSKTLDGQEVKAPLKKEKTKLTLFDKHVEKSNNENGESKHKVKEFLHSYQEVIKSKVYFGAVVGRILDVLAFKGYMVFLPKYLENHYGIPQYRVHLYMAAFGVFGFACGTAAGGLITKALKLNGRRAAIYVLIVSLINTSLFLSKTLLGCHSIVNAVGREGIPTNFNYTRTCNIECGCESSRLFPVCDVNGRTFYSPCHAGCRHVSVQDLDSYKLEFSECDCVPGGSVKKEYCQDDCEFMKYMFFLTVILGAFAAGTGVVPGMLLLLRSVPPHTRSPALGLQGFLVSLIGTMPSPVLWGWIIDSSCIVWDNVCSQRGSCQIYDPTKLRIRMHVLYCAIRCISMMTDGYVWYYAKGLSIQEEDDPEMNTTEVTEQKKEPSQEVNGANEIILAAWPNTTENWPETDK